tara:strand:+ start:4604 stop:5725 length:1122 start_codon:yes stop_codon:yes gene_type:complete
MNNRNVENSLLMAVFGQINSDGRVLRSIEALKDKFDISIFGSVSDENFSLKFVEVARYKYRLAFYSRVIDHILFHFKFVLRAIRTRPSIIYVHDYYLSALGVIAGRMCGAKIIYDAHELIIDSDYHESKRNWFYAQLEKRAIKKYDLVISANDERATQLINFYNLNQVQVVSIKNIPGKSVHEGTVSFLKLKKSFPFLNKNKKYIIYQGVVTPARDLENILDPLSQLKEYDILIVGDGPKKYYDSLVSKYENNTNIHFVGKVNLHILYSLVKISFCGIISYSMQNLNNKYCAPNKLYEYAQFNLKMLTTNQVLFDKTFKKFPFGMILSANTSKKELDLFLSEKINNSIFEDFRRKNSNIFEMEKLLSNVLTIT